MADHLGGIGRNYSTSGRYIHHLGVVGGGCRGIPTNPETTPKLKPGREFQTRDFTAYDNTAFFFNLLVDLVTLIQFMHTHTDSKMKLF